MFKDWLDIYKKINSSERFTENLECPECQSLAVDFQYVGDPKTRIGYLDIWCANCLRGVHLSRVSIPPGREMLSFGVDDEVFSARIPDFEQVIPDN
jgi:hypothetical protein